MPRVMTVDDQEVFRAAARAVVEATPGFESAGEPSSGEEALEVVDEAKPELVLVDVRMPGLGGVETARALRDRDPELVIVLVSLDDPPTGPGAEAIPFARKQDFGPGLLRDLWAVHGSRHRP
jgi:two-component system, NarL family, invasion response regulator UvrY